MSQNGRDPQERDYFYTRVSKGSENINLALGYAHIPALIPRGGEKTIGWTMNPCKSRA